MNKIYETCLNCGKELKGRLDKKFCDAYCRNTYNNKTVRENEKTIKQINSILRRNRTILKNINPRGMTTVREEYLKIIANQIKRILTLKESGFINDEVEFRKFAIRLLAGLE